ncbi:MAG: hypothetical protein HY934_03710 [Candidatus Firestonebacteria bacterium]|nr:hypothetical protein [Candidatus Firestonebacteria bacterium]
MISDEFIKKVRKFILECLFNTGRAPNLKKIMNNFELSKNEVIQILNKLEEKRHIKRVPGTQNILMALPFSNVTTAHEISLSNGKKFFCNGAIDSLGISFIFPEQEVSISSYCHHCGEPFEITLKEGNIIIQKPEELFVHLTTPAYHWLDDLTRTCGSINFFSSKEHVKEWEVEINSKGPIITLNQALSITKLINQHRLDLDYTRPSAQEFNNLLNSLSLVGSFWENPT